LSGRQRRPEAIAAYFRAIELDPKTFAPTAYFNLGYVLREWGKPDEAAAAYRKAIAANQPRPFASAHHCLGGVLCDQNKLDEAAAAYEKASALRPSSPDSHSQLAWIFASRPEAKLRDPKRAVALARRAAELALSSELAWQYLGWVHYRTGD